LESAEFRFDPSESGSSRELALRALRRTPHFRRGLSGEAFETLAEAVRQGLEGLRQESLAGFTICPLRTEAVRMTSLAIDVRFVGAIVTFAPAGSDLGEHGEAYRRLCRTYYRRVLASYVERTLPGWLAPEPSDESDGGHALACSAVSRCLEELSRRVPLGPFRERFEARLASTGDVRAALGWTREEMLEEASKRLSC
jgi:hypothetical protein